MKSLKRILLVSLSLVLLVIVFRGPLYRMSFTYKEIGVRASYTLSEETIPTLIDESTEDLKNPDITEIERLTDKMTSHALSFTAQEADIDPELTALSHETHCVGYAAFYSTIFNELCKRYGINNEWHANAVVGEMYFFGINVHSYIKHPFFKDHDFVIIQNYKTGSKKALDPTLSDYFNIREVRLQNKTVME